MTDGLLQVIPTSNQAYISASSSTSVTISGPPSILEQLFQFAPAFSSDRLGLPVSGPYHAPHLHHGVNANTILQATNPKTSHILKTYHLTLPLMSTSSGTIFPERLGAAELFAAVIDDILKETLCLQKIVHGIVSLAKHAECGQCKIHSFGPTSSELMIVKALESETTAKVTPPQDIQSSMANGLTPFGDEPRTSRKPKLAIVGMAGRFPDAADHEKFWNLLEAGLDVHRKVRYFVSILDEFTLTN